MRDLDLYEFTCFWFGLTGTSDSGPYRRDDGSSRARHIDCGDEKGYSVL